MYIYSTLSNSMKFNFFVESSLKQGNIPTIQKSVVVKGEANIANKHSEFPKVTETRVNDSDFEILKDNKQFKRLMRNGFLSTSSKRKLDISVDNSVDNIVKDMEKRSKSAALNLDDLLNSNKELKEIDLRDIR